MVRAVVGSGARLQRQVLYWAITLVLYAVCLLLLVVEVASGVAATHAVSWLVAAIGIGALPFYVPVRASERLGRSPSLLAMAQAVYAIGCILLRRADRVPPWRTDCRRHRARRPRHVRRQGGRPQARGRRMRLPPPNTALRRRRWHCAAALASLLLSLLLPVAAGEQPPLPQRDLLVELREADAGEAPRGAAGWSARSVDASTARERPPQQVRVRNGSSASLVLTVSRPVQVQQWFVVVVPAVPMGTTEWIDAGQSLTVQPRWPGGRAPVALLLSADGSRFDPTVAPGSAELPRRTAARVTTRISPPLGQWTTIGASGAGSDDPNVVASGEAAAAARRVLQVRVSLAP